MDMATAMAIEPVELVQIHEVYQHNLEYEFGLLNSVLPQFSHVSVDTEFPGTVFESQKPYYLQTPEDIYDSMKINVDATKMIQLGVTLSDANGSLPRFGSNDHGSIWQFNFSFDVDQDMSNSRSIQLLKNQGIEFDKHKANGIDTEQFAALFFSSGLGLSAQAFFQGKTTVFIPNHVTWVTFQGLYDLGYLIKILTKESMPEDRLSFTVMIRMYFGMSLFDVKEIIKPFGLRGGLDKVADQLGLTRTAGKSHQAGSDSLLTTQVFMKLKEKYFSGLQICRFNNKLQGLVEDESEVGRMFMIMKRECCQIKNTTFSRPHVLYPIKFYPPYPIKFYRSYPIKFYQSYVTLCS